MTRWNEHAEYLTRYLKLDLEIQAVKFITDPADVPADAVNAREQIGHLSLCQALAITKREGKTIYTTKYSEWCWAPLVSMGYVDCSPGSEAFAEISPLIGIQDQEEAKAFFARFPMLPRDKYCGLLIGPARTAAWEPDVFLINCDSNFQLRTLVGAVKFRTGKQLAASLDMIDSCIYTLFKSFLTKEYTFQVPDIGEQERALSGPHESILGVPAERMDELADGCRHLEQGRIGYTDMQPQMLFDFDRPSFYNRIYEIWGLEQGKTWDRE